MKVQLLVIAEIEIEPCDNPLAAAQAKFDAFREAVQPSAEWGITLFRAAPDRPAWTDNDTGTPCPNADLIGRAYELWDSHLRIVAHCSVQPATHVIIQDGSGHSWPAPAAAIRD